jgi:hypothetical protein
MVILLLGNDRIVPILAPMTVLLAGAGSDMAYRRVVWIASQSETLDIQNETQWFKGVL